MVSDEPPPLGQPPTAVSEFADCTASRTEQFESGLTSSSSSCVVTLMVAAPAPAGSTSTRAITPPSAAPHFPAIAATLLFTDGSSHPDRRRADDPRRLRRPAARHDQRLLLDVPLAQLLGLGDPLRPRGDRGAVGL